MRSFFTFIICSLLLTSPLHAYKGERRERAAKPKATAVAEAPVPPAYANLDDVARGFSENVIAKDRCKKAECAFLEGYKKFQEGRWKEADKSFRESAESLSVIGDHILYYRAVIANMLGRYSEAKAFLDSLFATHSGSSLAVEAEMERARAMTGLGEFAFARNALSRALARGGERFRADVQKLTVETYVKAGDGDGAVSYLKNVLISAPCEAEISGASDVIGEVKKRFGFDAVDWLHKTENQFRLARSFVNHYQWDDSAVILKRLLDKGVLEGREEIEAKWMLARASRWMHRYDEAIALMEGLVKDPGASSFMGELLSTLATTYAKKSDYEKAIDVRMNMIRELAPGSQSAAQLAYKVAFLYMDQGKFGEAIERWKNVERLYRGKWCVLARWNIAWSYYKLEEYEQALAVFASLEKSGAGRVDIADRVRYWKARTLAKLGRGNEAASVFGALQRKRPNGYYAGLSARQLAGDKRGIEDFAVAKGGDVVCEKEMGVECAEGPSHLGLAAIFDRLGLRFEAARELRAADKKELMRDSAAAMALGARNSAHDVAFRLARYGHPRVLANFPPSGGFDSLVWRGAYPKAYEKEVAKFAGDGGLDPKFVWAIMRTESEFRPHVVSPAGAVGLMQIMPSTANKTLSRLGLPSPARGELYEPVKNVFVGVGYLEDLYGMFPKNYAAIAASYNAGEEAAARWLAKGEVKDIEEWIEEIPYEETNLYVKKVMTAYWIYQRLYR